MDDSSLPTPTMSARQDGINRQVTICNTLGLHARAAAKFVSTVGQYNASVIVQRGDHRVSGRSIMGLMMLAASSGTTITIQSQGDQALQVMEALIQLINNRFHEAQ